MPGRSKFGLPILVKDLVEQAGRPRTYVLRVVYAVALFTAACVVFYFDSDRPLTSVSQLGRGRELFVKLTMMQFWGVCLFFPGMACGAITSEKERDCLALLIVSRLDPWEILLQKYLARVLPMLSALLISLPLVAIAFSYGGVSVVEVWCSLILLAFVCLLIGALGMLVSAFFRTTAEAFVAAYVGVGALFCGCVALPMSDGSLSLSATPATTFAAAVPMLAMTAMMLGLARVALIERAFVPHRNLLLIVFRAVDAVFNETNHLTGGVVLVRDKNLLPGDRPVAWRETAKKSLGTARYLFRVLAVLMTPILLVGTSDVYSDREGALTTFAYLLWGIAGAMVASHAAGLISSERSRQTLSVLLTTPLTGAEIVRQKLAGVWRLVVVLAAPFTAVAWFKSAAMPGDPWIHPCMQTVAPFAYLPLIAWASMAIGLRIASQSKAIMVAIMAIVLWAVAPLAIHNGLDAMNALPKPPWSDRLLTVVSPARLVLDLERRQASTPPQRKELAWAGVANLGLHVAMALAVRHGCLRHADRRLGRGGGRTDVETA